MSHNRYRIILTSLLLLAVPATALAQRGGNVEILDEFTIEPDSLVVTVSATGVIEPERSVDLTFEQSGPVDNVCEREDDELARRVCVQEGDSVRQGDILAQLDADELRAAVREAEIALELQELALEALIEPPREVDVIAAQAAVAAAEAAIPAAGFGPTREQVEIARVQADLARNQLWQTQLNRDIVLDRGREFYDGNVGEIQQEGAVSAAEFDVTIADAQIEATIRSGGGAGAIASAEAQLVQSQIALEDLLNGPDAVDLLRFEIQLDQARLSLELAQASLEDSQIVAPFDGVVAQYNLTPGENPPIDQPAVQIIDNSAFYVELGIDESDVVDIAVGQTVSLRLDALPEAEISGTIERIAITPDPTATTIVYRARVLLDPTEANVRVGMSTTATIVTQELTDVLIVPNRFIRVDRETQQAFVTIQRPDEQFEEIPVTLGERNAQISQITSGVEPGQRIVQIPRETLGLGEVLGGNPGEQPE
ncbi:MAG: efflux RND transporter periplasmic adaptor subunit [Chloroflexota bacterium]